MEKFDRGKFDRVHENVISVIREDPSKGDEVYKNNKDLYDSIPRGERREDLRLKLCVFRALERAFMTLYRNTSLNEKLLDVRIHEEDFSDIKEVDSKIVKLAQLLSAKVFTNDFNLNKVAELHGIKVLNINTNPVSLVGLDL